MLSVVEVVRTACCFFLHGQVQYAICVPTVDNRRGRDEKIIVTAMSIFASEDSVAAASGTKQRNGIIVTI